MINKLFPTEPTPQQIMEVLRGELATSSYHLFDVAMRFRLEESDFLAVDTGNPCEFLIARAGSKSATVQPYANKSHLRRACLVVEKLKYEDRQLVRWKNPIDLRRKNLKIWHFIPPRQHAELARLYPTLILNAA